MTCVTLHSLLIPCLRRKKYAVVVKEAQLKRLQAMRIPVSEMVHAPIEAPFKTVLTGAGGLTVGEWVDVQHDFSPGHNSGGGVGVIIEIIERLSHVRYIVDGHVEKFIPLTRLTTIPMPFRREKAKLRTRSSQPETLKQGT